MGNFLLRYASRVIIYERTAVIRLVTKVILLIIFLTLPFDVWVIQVIKNDKMWLRNWSKANKQLLALS